MNQTISIAMVHDYPPSEGGGIEVNVSRVAFVLRKMGFNVKIFTSRETSHSLPGPVSIGPDSYIHIKAPTEQNAKNIVLNNDVIHIHLTFSLHPLSMRVLEMCNALNKRVIISFHTTPSHIEFSRIATLTNKDELIAKMINCVNETKAVVLTYSDYNSNALWELGVRAPMIKTLIGIDSAFYNVDLHQKHQYDFAYIGELSNLKGTDDLIRLVENLKYDYAISPRVLLLGDGPLRKWVEEQAHMKELDIDVKGYIEHSLIPLLMQKTLTVVHLSKSENYPLSLLESLAMRKIIVARNVGGIGELLEKGWLGFLVENVQEASQLVANLILGNVDTTELKQHLDNGFHHSRIKHSYTSQARQLIDVYCAMHEVVKAKDIETSSSNLMTKHPLKEMNYVCG